MKATPKTLATGSNNPNKQVSVNVWNNGHNVHGMTRAELQALTPTAGQIGYCKESGREGEFVWDSSDHSANVTRDTAQGLYIPPASDTTGASGAWVRKYSGPANIKWFGALGDGSTNDYAAFAGAASALPMGGFLHIPTGAYRVNSKVDFLKHIHITGEGFGQIPAVAHPSNYKGSVIITPAGQSGFEFHPFTTTESIATVLASLPGGYTDRSAFNSSISNVMLVSLGTTGGAPSADVGTIGIRSRTRLNLDNVAVIGYHDNIIIEASADTADAALGRTETGGDVYGNANGSVLNNVKSWMAGRTAVGLYGRDANAIHVIGIDCQNYGTAGLVMKTLLGNTVTGGHFDGGGYGTTPIQTYSAVALHKISGVYLENGTCDLSSVTTFIAGQGASASHHPSASGAFVLNAGRAERRGLEGANDLDAIDVSFGIGRDENQTPRVAAWHGTSDDSGGGNQAYRLKYQFIWTGIWAWTYRNALDYLEIASGQTSFYSTRAYSMAVGFPQGIAIGTCNSAPRLLPAAAAAPTTGGAYLVGDVVLNNGASGPLGWKCTVAGSPGTWAPLGYVSTQGAAVADLTTTATAGTLPTPDGSVTIANAATPTVTELLEYCVELEAKLETLLARVRAHGLIAT